MVVRLKNISEAQRKKELTPGNQYRVIEISPDRFRVMNDCGKPSLYDWNLFEIVMWSVPEDWVFELSTEDNETSVYAGPACFAQPGFFEDYFDHKNEAISVFRVRLTQWAYGEDYLPNRHAENPE